MLGEEYRQKGGRDYEQVSVFLCPQGPPHRVRSLILTIPLPRLLLVFRKLEDISAAVGQWDMQNDHLLEAKAILEAICKDHVHAAETFIGNADLRASLCREMEGEIHELVEYIVAAKRFNLEADSRAKDRIVSVGEKLSCRFMTAMLRDRVWTCLPFQRLPHPNRRERATPSQK